MTGCKRGQWIGQRTGQDRTAQDRGGQDKKTGQGQESIEQNRTGQGRGHGTTQKQDKRADSTRDKTRHFRISDQYHSVTWIYENVNIRKCSKIVKGMSTIVFAKYVREICFWNLCLKHKYMYIFSVYMFKIILWG